DQVQIGATVLVAIEDRDGRRMAAVVDAGGGGDVVIAPLVPLPQLIGRLAGVSDVEVEVAVTVVVEDGRRVGPGSGGEAELGGDLGQLAAVLTIERRAAFAADDEEVEIAVALEIVK